MDVDGIEALLGLPEFRVFDLAYTPISWICICNDVIAPSCVPGARRAALDSTIAVRGAFATCPS